MGKERGKEKGHRENRPVSSSTCRLFPRRDPRHHRVKPPTFLFFIFPPKKFPFDLLVLTPFEPFDKLLRGPQLRIIGNLIDGPLNSLSLDSVRLIFEMSQHRRLWHQHIFSKTVAYRLSTMDLRRSLVLIIWWCCCRMVPFQRASCRMHTVSHDDDFSLK